MTDAGLQVVQQVRLIWATPNAEDHILYIARVSSNQENKDVGLIRYLLRNKHWSPFEMASMCLEFTTSRAIAPQLLRHRSFSFQEFSQRYADPEGFILYPGRRQAEKNRQSSTDNLDDETQEWWIGAQTIIASAAAQLYQEAIARGVARESARFILPASTTTKLYMTGTLRSWIHYLEARTDPHTQEEHRQLAAHAEEIFAERFPRIYEAWALPGKEQA